MQKNFIAAVLWLGALAAMPAASFGYQYLVVDTPVVNLGPVPVGQTFGPVTVQVVNVGTDPITISAAGGATQPPFSSFQGCQGLTLNPGDSCPRNFMFTPTALGPVIGASNAIYNGFELNVELRGEGVLPDLTVSTPSVDFGTVQVGVTSPTISVDVINQGAIPMTLGCSGGATPAPFASTQGCQGVTLNPGDSCPLNFRFLPTSLGPASATSGRSCNGVQLAVELVGEAVAGLEMLHSAVDFGQVVVGATSPTTTVDVINRGNLPITLSCSGGGTAAPFSSSQGCQGVTLNPGDSCPRNVTFSPTSVGPQSANADSLCNGVLLPLALTGEGVTTVVEPALVFGTPAIAFGAVQVGATSPTITLQLQNQGAAALAVTCNSVTTAPPFGESQACQGATLPAGASCPWNFVFSPTSSGPASELFSVRCNGIDLTVQLSGEGAAPALILETPAVDFGPVPVGEASPVVALQLRNQGTAPLTLSCAGGAAAAPFNASQGCQGVTLAPGASCPWNYSFSPLMVGVASGASSFSCNGRGLSVDLVGEGVLPALIVERPAVDFGPILVGNTSSTVSVELVNRGPVPLTLGCAGGAVGAPFNASQGCQGATLAPGASCPWNYAFSPAIVGLATSTSGFSCNGAQSVVDLMGLGISNGPAMTASPSALVFPVQTVGTTSPPMSTMVINAGLTALQINDVSVAGVDAADFAVSGACSALPTVAGLGTCGVEVVFSPTDEGIRSAEVVVSAAGGVPSLSIPLEGLGQLALAIITPSPLPDGISLQAYSAVQMLAEGGTGVYTNWAVIAGSLPAGFSLDPVTGLIDGVGAAPGTSVFTIEVTDSAGAVASAELTLTILSVVSIPTLGSLGLLFLALALAISGAALLRRPVR